MVKSQGLKPAHKETRTTSGSHSEPHNGALEPQGKAAAGSRSELRRLLADYQTACRSGEAGEATLQSVVSKLTEKLGKEGTSSKHWSKYSSLVESALNSTAVLLKQITIPASMLAHIKTVLPFSLPFPSLLLLIYKRTARIYLHSPPDSAQECLDFLISVIHLQGVDKASLLTAALRTYARLCSEYRPDFDQLQKRVLRLLKTDMSACEGAIATQLKRFTSDLQLFSDTSSKEPIESIVNWQFLQLMGLCGIAISTIRKPSERYIDQWLQIMFTAVKISHEFRFVPWKLQLTHVLIQVETASKVYFPGVSSVLLSLLTSPDLHKRIKPTEASIDLSSMLKAEQHQLVAQAFREALIRGICRNLMLHLVVFAQNPSFPELSLPVREVLSRETQESRKQLSHNKSVLEKTLKTLTEASNWAETRRQVQSAPLLSGVSPLVQALS